MAHATITLIDPELGEQQVSATASATSVFVSPDVIASATGWFLKPEGLCRGEVCVPVRDGALVDETGDLDVERFAAALGLPAVLDIEEGVLSIGETADARADVIATGIAPDFELPTLDGTPFRFSSIGRKKKVLVAWASW